MLSIQQSSNIFNVIPMLSDMNSTRARRMVSLLVVLLHVELHMSRGEGSGLVTIGFLSRNKVDLHMLRYLFPLHVRNHTTLAES